MFESKPSMAKTSDAACSRSHTELKKVNPQKDQVLTTSFRNCSRPIISNGLVIVAISQRIIANPGRVWSKIVSPDVQPDTTDSSRGEMHHSRQPT